tara:strand:+ start:1291 stop:1800 length:510 start_codon:yes stop_codon:yes gene_type:complete
MSNDTKNPANVPELPKGYRPMTSATMRLEVPERDGYHRHWFRGTGERLARAQQAGYTFVNPADTQVNNFDLGGDSNDSGNTDLGSRVSIVSGDELDNSGQPGRMYLMECPEHLYDYSQKILEERNESVAEALRGGKLGTGYDGETGTDSQNRYVKGKSPDLFTPRKNRR